MHLSLDERLRAAIALADGVRNPHELPADEVADRHRETVDQAVTAGLTPERAAEVADETQRVLVAFAEALRTAADAAEAVLKLSDLLDEEIENARTD